MHVAAAADRVRLDQGLGPVAGGVVGSTGAVSLHLSSDTVIRGISTIVHLLEAHEEVIEYLLLILIVLSTSNFLALCRALSYVRLLDSLLADRWFNLISSCIPNGTGGLI